MKLTLPRAVIFDWDNTLVDSWDAIMAAMNGALTYFAKPAWTLDEVKQRCKYAAKDYFPAIFGDDWEKARDVYYQHFNASRIDHSAMPLTGAGDLLRWLKEHDIPAFVVSNKRGDYLRQESAALEWDQFFVALVGATDTAESKPSRQPVDLALSKGGLTPDTSVWFVGDTDVDMQCARNSGCTPVFVGNVREAARLEIKIDFIDCQALKAALDIL